MTILARVLLAMALLGYGGVAKAAPECQDVAPLQGPPPLSQVDSMDVGLAIAGTRLAIWPLGPVRLNPEAGIEVQFRDGSNCVSTFTEAASTGISLRATGPVAAVEAAVCDVDGHFCTPVRVEPGR